MLPKGYKDAVALLVLLVICLCTHLIYVGPLGQYVQNGDTWIYPLFAHQWVFTTWGDHSRQWFPFSLSYGGVGPFTALRIAVVALSKNASEQWIWVQSHLWISNVVTPLAVTASAYYYLRRTVGYQGAVAVGLLVAVGFAFPESLYGLDTFAWFFCALFLFLGLRADVENPLQEWSWLKLFCTAIALGFTTYVMRASILLLPAVYIPLSWLRAVLKRLRRPKNVFEKTLLAAAAVLLTLATYINIFGRELATWGVKHIVVDAYPNVRAAVYVMVVWALWCFARLLNKKLIKTAVIIAAGFILGLSPEIYSVASGQSPFFQSFTTGADEVSWYKTLVAVNELMGGRFDQRGYESPLWFAYYGLCVWTLCYVVMKASQLKLSKSVVPALLVFAANLYAFFRVKNSGAGASRYLMTFFPLFLWCMAIFYESLWMQRRRSVQNITALFLCAVTAFTFYINRQHVVAELGQKGLADAEKMQPVIARLRVHGVEYAWAPDFWDAVPHTVQSRGRPVFVQPLELRIPFVTNEELATSGRLALVLYDKSNLQDLPQKFETWGHKWNVERLEILENHVAIGRLKP